MSELVPEVGDLWSEKNNENYKVVVSYIDDSSDVLFCACGYCNFLLKVKTHNRKNFFRKYKYLGKSKANINQLFEVQDD